MTYKKENNCDFMCEMNKPRKKLTLTGWSEKKPLIQYTKTTTPIIIFLIVGYYLYRVKKYINLKK